MVRDTRVPTKVFSLDIWMVSCIRERSFASTSNRPAKHWSNKVNHIEQPVADCGEEVNVAVHTCMSFAPKIAVVVDNHSHLAIHTSDVVEWNISAYLLDNESSDDEGVDVDNLSNRRCIGSRWDPLDRMTGCLVVLVIYVLHADGVVVAVVLSVVQHNVSHVDVGERMTTPKIGRLISVHGWSFESRGRAEKYTITNECIKNDQPFTNECAENYQLITNEWLLVSRWPLSLLHLQLTQWLTVV